METQHHPQAARISHHIGKTFQVSPVHGVIARGLVYIDLTIVVTNISVTLDVSTPT